MIELIGTVAVIVLLLLCGLAVAFEKGWIGLSASRLAKMRARVDELQDKFDAAAKKKAAAVPSTLTPAEERIARNAALLAAGTITQADFDAAKAKILAE